MVDIYFGTKLHHPHVQVSNLHIFQLYIFSWYYFSWGLSPELEQCKLCNKLKRAAWDNVSNRRSWFVLFFSSSDDVNQCAVCRMQSCSQPVFCCWPPTLTSLTGFLLLHINRVSPQKLELWFICSWKQPTCFQSKCWNGSSVSVGGQCCVQETERHFKPQSFSISVTYRSSTLFT